MKTIVLTALVVTAIGSQAFASPPPINNSVATQTGKCLAYYEASARNDMMTSATLVMLGQRNQNELALNEAVVFLSNRAAKNITKHADLDAAFKEAIQHEPDSAVKASAIKTEDVVYNATLASLSAGYGNNAQNAATYVINIKATVLECDDWFSDDNSDE